MICEKCGANIPESMKFCGECGAKLKEDITILPAQELPTTQEAIPLQIDTIPKNDISDSPEKQIIKHEKATQAPLLSIAGLFSIKGRRSRLPMLAVRVLAGIIGAIPIIGFVLSIWIETTNLFKRLHDLDQPEHVGIFLTVLNAVLWLALLNADGSLLFPCSFILFIVNLYLLFWPGSPGANSYGRSPEELKHISKYA